MKIIFKRFQYLLNRRLFVILLVLAQIAFLTFLVLEYSKLHWLSVLLNVISLITALHLVTRQCKNAFKISLVFLILLFPLFGGIFYWILHFQTTTVGFRKRLQKIERRSRSAYKINAASASEVAKQTMENQQLVHYLDGVPGFSAYGNTQTTYLPTGAQMLDLMLEDIKNAKHYVFLEYFIVEEGRMWNSILDLLEEKAKQGVDVRVIYDDLGCFLTLPPGYEKKLRARGIKCAVFNKVRPFLSTAHNNRDHRKITVIDGKVAYTGGMNLADEYINEKIKYGHWKDASIRLYGNGAWSFTVMFLHMWSLLTRTEEHIEDYQPERMEVETDGWVQPYTDSPIDKENVGERVYMHLIQKAKKYLYITTPYLMVDDDLISALKSSAKSGVDVRIITPSWPDKKAVHFTTRSYYRELIDAGVKIYEYGDGFMHAKIFLTDDVIATVGTANLDFRSLYLHFECGTCLYQTSSIQDIKEDYLKSLERCEAITDKDCKPNLFIKVCQDICRIFAPLM